MIDEQLFRLIISGLKLASVHPTNYEKTQFVLHCTKNEVFHYGFLQLIWPNPQFSADLVTLTEEILTGKLQFLRSVDCSLQ